MLFSPLYVRGSSPKNANFANGLYRPKVTKVVDFTHLMVFLKFGEKTPSSWCTGFI
jgi:hypothetical protein